ncbi:MAG: LysR family transcriptional regulator [Gammaproteobacteria bacterium]|nr:LysR family transcriptional regulator [Gammaproteobacteria bacterium]
MDKLHAMTTFVHIAEHGSLTRAAELLDTSLPSVVRTLAALEKTLGTRLLNRTTRKLALTQEGRDYLDRCRSILADIAAAEQALTSQQHAPSGSLRVTAPVLFGQLHVTPIITSFITHYRKVNVELLLLDRVVNLVEEGIDVALRIGELADSSLVAIPVGHIRRVVCASPKYLKRAGIPKHPADLAAHACLRTTGLTPSQTWQFVEKGRALHVHVTGPFVCNQVVPSIDACVSGLGLGMFYMYQVQHLLAQNKLALVLEAFEQTPQPVSIVYPHAKLLSTRMRCFIDWTAQRLRPVINVPR